MNIAKKFKNFPASYATEAIYELEPEYEINGRVTKYILVSKMRGSNKIDLYECDVTGTLTTMSVLASAYERATAKDALKLIGYTLVEDKDNF